MLMPKVQRSKPPTHVVVVDTNILWDKDKKLSVSPAFDHFWKSNSALIPLELRVPEVVFGELHFQQTTSALKSLSTISEAFDELSGITTSKYGHKCNESTIRSQVKSKLDRWLKTHSGSVVATPVSKIDWQSLVDAAIWRKPPFTFDAKDKGNEKGFRDAVILETLAHVCETSIAGTTVIFVCNDHLLRTTAEHRLKSKKKLLAFESLADFGSYVNLTQQQFTNTFVKAIQNHARSKFFSKADANCVFTKFSVAETIHCQFAAELSIIPPEPSSFGLLGPTPGSTSWRMVRSKNWIRSTQFTKVEDEREFHWASRVEIARLFEAPPATGLIASAMPPAQQVLIVGFEVKWKANVKTDGRFHEIAVLGIDKIDTEMLVASSDNLARLKLV
jgi:hypothetical protein